MAKSVYIFSNGDEYRHWEAHNCGRCPHSCYNNGQGEDEFPNCKIEAALMLGVVTRRQRWFAGYERPGDCTTWRCRYRQQMDKRTKRPPVFGHPFWINHVKKNERRDKLKDAILAVFDEFGDMKPYEMGVVIHTAASAFYKGSDVLDIHGFIRGVKVGSDE